VRHAGRVLLGTGAEWLPALRCVYPGDSDAMMDEQDKRIDVGGVDHLADEFDSAASRG